MKNVENEYFALFNSNYKLQYLNLKYENVNVVIMIKSKPGTFFQFRVLFVNFEKRSYISISTVSTAYKQLAMRPPKLSKSIFSTMCLVLIESSCLFTVIKSP